MKVVKLMKRIVTVQDISCVGKCSLTVALPIISAMGTETAVIPTAVLSNHTAFSDFTFTDLTDNITPIADRLHDEGITFDAIYTGYLGSFRQIEIVENFISRFRDENVRVIVDPAMADNGKLYTGFDVAFAERMTLLCSHADIILPNYTEACFMLGEDCASSACTEDVARITLPKLTALGARVAVITGVTRADGAYGAVGYNSSNGEFFSAFSEHVSRSFHGTGDVFASTFVGALMRDMSLGDALGIAVDFTVACIKSTVADPNSNWYGVNFESAIPMLIDRMRGYTDE